MSFKVLILPYLGHDMHDKTWLSTERKAPENVASVQGHVDGNQ